MINWITKAIVLYATATSVITTERGKLLSRLRLGLRLGLRRARRNPAVQSGCQMPSEIRDSRFKPPLVATLLLLPGRYRRLLLQLTAVHRAAS